MAKAAPVVMERALTSGLDYGLPPMPPEAAAALQAVAAPLADNPPPTLALNARDFALDQCRAPMREAPRMPVPAGRLARPAAQQGENTMAYGVTGPTRPWLRGADQSFYND